MALEAESYVPPPVPGDQNFALTPFLKPLFDFLPGTQSWQGTNDNGKALLERIDAAHRRSRTLGFDLGGASQRPWHRGFATDVIALLGTNRTQPSGQGAGVAVAPRSEPPGNAAAAAAIIRQVQRDTLDPIFDELAAARRRPYSRFPIRYDWIPCTLLRVPHLAVVTELVRQLLFRCQAQLALGCADAAFEDLSLAQYLGDTLKDEPLFGSLGARIVCRALVTQAIYDGMCRHQWSDAQLRQMIEQCGIEDFVRDTQRVMRAEVYGWAVRLVEQIRSGQISAGDLNTDLGVAPRPRRWFDDIRLSAPPDWLHFESIRLCTAYEMFFQPLELWDKTMGLRSLFWSELARTEAEFCPTNPGWFADFRTYRTLGADFSPTLTRGFRKGFAVQTAVVLTRAACALELYYLAHGCYPEELEAMVPDLIPALPVEAMTGRTLSYRREKPGAFALIALLPSPHSGEAEGAAQATTRKSALERALPEFWVWQIPAKPNP